LIIVVHQKVNADIILILSNLLRFSPGHGG
jgi:hypothetical protein